MYYEDFHIEARYRTQSRTMTEADILNFCGLTGDFNQIHTSAEYAKSTIYGQRIAHGLLTLSIASGLLLLSGLLEGTVVAFESIRSWQFKRPLFIGDTLYVESRVAEKEERPLKAGLNAGLVTLELQVKKMPGRLCQKGLVSVLVHKRAK